MYRCRYRYKYRYADREDGDEKMVPVRGVKEIVGHKPSSVGIICT